jgi:hypothetical protein
MRITIAIIIALACIMTGCVSTFVEKKPLIPVLCLASYDTKIQGLDSIDPKAIDAYRGMGFDLQFNYYQKIDPKILNNYPVVIGMIPQLHAGTRAIDDKLGKAFSRYIQRGGGFLLIPGPSYYGVTDFVKQLNPWLKPYGATLLSEIPYDPENQKNLTRVLDYRYLKTTNIADHQVTDGIDELWFPLDFSDSYVRTHTMTLTPDWKVLVKGEKTCQTYPFETISKGVKRAGSYQADPPLLAVRDIGKGKLAILSSASRYFVYDAFHWAHGSGFVLKNNGLQLMANLLTYLDSGMLEKKYQKSQGKPMIVGVQGNVPVEPDKKAWLDYVLKNFKPENCQVKYYVDCGAMADLPYTAERGFGFIDKPYTNWVIRWPWSDIFHATASNSRAFDVKKLEYQFDNLKPAKQYWLGVLVWGYQKEGAETIRLKSKASKEWQKLIQLPKKEEQMGPLFRIVEIPESLIQNGTLNLEFGMKNITKGFYSSICELWLFEEGQGNNVNAESIIAEFEPAFAVEHEKTKNLKNFNGLIGVKSNYTSGQNRVAEYAAAAKQAGFSFIVFTDEQQALGTEKWQQLVNECRQVSDNSFRAIPGFSFRARYKNLSDDPVNPHSNGDIQAYVFQNPASLPDKKLLGNPYSLFWKYFGGELAGGKKTEPTLLQPGKNGISPFFQRFWRGFNVFTLNENGAVIDNAEALYVDLLAAGYGPYPRVSGDYRSVADIRRAKHGWRTVIPARSLDTLTLYHYGSYITNGPRLIRYSMNFNQLQNVDIGGGIVLPGTEWGVVNIKIKAKSPIMKVMLYSGKKVLRSWKPGKKVFKVKEALLLGKQHQLWLKVEADNSEKLLTGPIQVADHRFMTGMCADNQNTICNLTNKVSRFVRDEREIYLQHSYWHTGEAAGQIGSLKDARALVPRIVEVGIIQPVKHFEPAPNILFADGSNEKHLQGEMRIKESNRDCNKVEYQFNMPDSKTSSQVSITSYRTLPGGSTAFLITSQIKAKCDIKLKDNYSLQVLSLAMMPPLAPKWNVSYKDNNGEIVTREFASLAEGEQIRAMLGRKSGIMIWPNDIGNLLVLPLDDNPYSMSFDNLIGVWNGREHISLFRPVKELHKNAVLTSLFLVLLVPEMIDSGNDLKRIITHFTQLKPVVKQISLGHIESTEYPITLSASGNAVSGLFDTREYNDPVPVNVTGINSNWSCMVVQNGHEQILEGSNNRLDFVLEPATDELTVVAGNPLVADNADSVIEWAGIVNNGVRFHVHNPTERSMTFIISSNKAFANVPPCNISLTLEAGASQWCWAKGRQLKIETIKQEKK